MSDKRPISVHFKRMATMNVLLFLYFISPSFCSFVTITVGLFVICTDSPYETITNLLNSKDGCSFTQTINKMFNSFCNFTVIEQVLGIFAVRIFIEVTWFVPTWLLIFFAAELFGSWTLLEDFGVIDLIKEHHSKVHEALRKVADMIPKYKE